ncbi:Dihydroorotate dehydrogenase (quinone) [hydrothermal vent metagenome]|uniref:dihydroorotate dehydrogenase (quinone) n=1 Tax=hydrothermal vent metagenome TaxID=652676 RepID=A0A3B0RR39_9ZZZZ
MNPLHQLAPKALRLLDAETAHGVTLAALKAGFGPGKPKAIEPILATKIAGLSLPGPVGLAAGFDKNAEVPLAMAGFGFGWIECGTVTPLAQKGNAKPRLFRLPRDQAVMNRLGFNNRGLQVFASNLAKANAAQPHCPIGANIGANKQSSDRIEDYCTGLRRLWGLPAWFTINISSPNTPGLRDLQNAQSLDELLSRIMAVAKELAASKPMPPIFLKIAPDLTEPEIETITNACLRHRVSGLIVSNTTLARPKGLRSNHRAQSGGLSGAPLFERSTKVLALFRQASGGQLPLIGVGGIATADQAWQKIKAGASVLQLYSALIYHGPELVSQIHDGLAERLRAHGFTALADAVGIDQPL